MILCDFAQYCVALYDVRRYYVALCWVIVDYCARVKARRGERGGHSRTGTVLCQVSLFLLKSKCPSLQIWQCVSNYKAYKYKIHSRAIHSETDPDA